MYMYYQPRALNHLAFELYKLLCCMCNIMVGDSGIEKTKVKETIAASLALTIIRNSYKLRPFHAINTIDYNVYIPYRLWEVPVLVGIISARYELTDHESWFHMNMIRDITLIHT